MPQLAQIMITGELGEDSVFHIIQNTLNECGCVSLLAESERHGLPMERIRLSLQSLGGVTCDDEQCCITDLPKFSMAMKRLAGGE